MTKTDELREDISEQIRRTVDRRQNNIATNIAKSEIVWNEEINVKTRTATAITECATEYYQCTETYVTLLGSTVKITCRCPCHEQKKGTGVKANNTRFFYRNRRAR